MIPSKLPECKEILKLKKIVYRKRGQNEMSNICIIKIVKREIGKMEHRQCLKE